MAFAVYSLAIAGDGLVEAGVGPEGLGVQGSELADDLADPLAAPLFVAPVVVGDPARVHFVHDIPEHVQGVVELDRADLRDFIVRAALEAELMGERVVHGDYFEPGQDVELDAGQQGAAVDGGLAHRLGRVVGVGELQGQLGLVGELLEVFCRPEIRRPKAG